MYSILQCGLTSQSGKILGQLLEENSSLKDLRYAVIKSTVDVFMVPFALVVGLRILEMRGFFQ